ncbi:MAG: L-aspartate oxidase [Planctomycetes bacterium]|nr:L-aspartate oxidase [Planctomycetota bacterium]
MHAARFPTALGEFDARRTPVLRTDVLVIGAGIAGASAALTAAEAGASVLCVTKAPFGDANTAWAKGGFAAVLAENDSFELHREDSLRVGAGLSSQLAVDRIVREGPEVYRWLSELGAQFDHDADGRIVLSREGGHSVHRVVHANGDATGLEIERVLAQRLEADDRVICRVGAFVRDLLVEEGRCVGAVIVEKGVELAVHAGAVVMASGGAGQVFRETTNPPGAGGDGIALAFRAGARLADMEFFQFHPTVLYIAGASRFLISEVVRGAGGQLRDRAGHRFMPEVHRDGELAPRDVVSRAILNRMVETGDTHVYLDLSSIGGDPHALFPSISRICRAFDIDIATDPIPVRPGAHYLIGGIQTDLDGRSSLPGLFAVGEAAATYLHGANRLASNSLLEGAVLGRAAGRRAAAELRFLPFREPHNAPPRSATFAPHLQLDDMLYSLKSLMWRQVGLVRDQQGLDEAGERIGLWHHYLERADGRDRRSYELQNMLTTSALIATAAAARRESRGTHFRSDFPERDDPVWCRHLTLSRSVEGAIHVEQGPLEEPTDSACP